MRPAFLARFLPPLLLAGLTLVLFWDVLLGGRRFFFGDLGLYFVPLLHFQRETLLSGHLALWNPTILCGTPLWGNPQAFPLYPASLLLFVLPASQIAGILAAVHVWLASYGTFLFLRGRGISVAAALFAAIAWGMGGALVSKAQFPNMIATMAYLPWLLRACEGVIARPNVKSASALGVWVGLALLAAHPQIFMMQFYVGLAWTAFLLWRKERRTVARAGGYLALGFALGVGLACGQLLPTVDLVRASVRTHLTLAQANRFILPPYALFTNFVAPNFYGNPATDTEYVARGNFWEPCAFMGVLPFAFALWAGFRLFRANREVRFWAVVALVGIWLAVGRDAGLWAAAFYVLPGVSKFHDAARFLYVGTWGLACLAAFGMDAILSQSAFFRTSMRRHFVASALIGITAWQVVAFGRTLNPTTPASVWAGIENPHEQNTITPGRTYFADERKAWAKWVSYRTYRGLQSDRDVRRFLGSRTANTNVFFDAPDAGGYEPVRRSDTNALLTILQNDMQNRAFTDTAWRMGVTHIVRLDNDFVPVSYVLPNALGRAVFMPDGEKNTVAQTVPLAVTDSSPQRVWVSLPPVHSSGTVVLADTLHPGWVARVDEGLVVVPTPSGGAFRAVRVRKNSKTVDFAYNPASVRFGVFLSLLAAGIMAAIPFSDFCRRMDAKLPNKPSTGA